MDLENMGINIGSLRTLQEQPHLSGGALSPLEETRSLQQFFDSEGTKCFSSYDCEFDLLCCKPYVGSGEQKFCLEICNGIQDPPARDRQNVDALSLLP